MLEYPQSLQFKWNWILIEEESKKNHTRADWWDKDLNKITVGQSKSKIRKGKGKSIEGWIEIIRINDRNWKLV